MNPGPNPTSITSLCSRGCGYGAAHPHLLLTFLPVEHRLLALPKGAEEAMGAVCVTAAVLPSRPCGQAQPKVFVTEVSVGTGAGGAAWRRLHWKKSRGVRGARIHPHLWDGSEMEGQHRMGLGLGSVCLSVRPPPQFPRQWSWGCSG